MAIHGASLSKRRDPSGATRNASITLATERLRLEIEAICSDLTTFVPGRRLDDNVNLSIHYKDDARGVVISSQISTGEENGLSIRVYGTEGGLQ